LLTNLMKFGSTTIAAIYKEREIARNSVESSNSRVTHSTTPFSA